MDEIRSNKMGLDNKYETGRNKLCRKGTARSKGQSLKARNENHFGMDIIHRRVGKSLQCKDFLPAPSRETNLPLSKLGGIGSTF